MWSTERFVPPPVYIGFPLFVLAKRRSRQFFTVRWMARRAVGFENDRNVGTLFCPASPRSAVRPALGRPDPPVVCPGFGFESKLLMLTKRIFTSLISFFLLHVYNTHYWIHLHRSGGLGGLRLLLRYGAVGDGGGRSSVIQHPAGCRTL